MSFEAIGSEHVGHIFCAVPSDLNAFEGLHGGIVFSLTNGYLTAREQKRDRVCVYMGSGIHHALAWLGNNFL
jgi:hypothetical protein